MATFAEVLVKEIKALQREKLKQEKSHAMTHDQKDVKRKKKG